MVWLSDGERILKICFLVSTEYMNVMDRWMDVPTLHSIVWQKLPIAKLLLL